MQTRPIARGMTIVEVAVAVAILSIVILGSVKALEGAAAIQSVTKERQAATMAASSQLNDLAMLASVDEAGWNSIANWNQTGFPVTLSARVVGASADFSAATSNAGGTMVAADSTSTRWPATRANAGAGVQAQAGFIEVVDVAGRTGLKQITVTVAWRSASGNDDVISLTQLVVNPEY